MGEELNEEGPVDGSSRRAAIKRIGVGAAVAWSAPSITSIGRAAAASPVGCPDACPGSCFGGECGTDPNGSACVCADTADGSCLCFQPICGGGACNDTSDCPPGYACISSAADCCGVGSFCAPLCDTPVSPEQNGNSARSAWG